MALNVCATLDVWAQASSPEDHPLFSGPPHETPVPRFDQQHLRLALEFDRAEQRLYGDVTLRIALLDPSADSLLLFAAHLMIDSVQVGLLDSAKVATPFRISGTDSLLIALDSLQVTHDSLRTLEAPFEVRIWYQAQPRRGLYFIQPTPENPTQKEQIWTSGLPEDHRHWLPFVDTPADRLTTELLVTVEPPVRVLSNGRLVEEHPNDDGSITTHYIQDRPIAPHQIMLVIGDYEGFHKIVGAPSINEPVALSYWTYPEGVGDIERTFGHTLEMLQFFTEFLNVPFPWRSYAQVVLHQFHPETMSTPGISAFSDGILLDERAVLDEDPDPVIARGLARQWFGGLVTPRYWNDLWLADGFATYLSALFEEHRKGVDAISLTMQAYADAYLAETRRYRRPLVWTRWDDPLRMFDAHGSYKGAWVLHMLRRQLGDARFRQVLNRYLNTNAVEPVESTDFKNILEAVADADFDSFFNQWVYAAGHPVLDVRYAFNDEAGQLTVEVEQVQEGYLVPDVFTVELTVEIHTLTEVIRHTLEVDARSQRFALPLPSRPRFLLVDPDREWFAEIRVEQEANGWVGQLRYAPTPVDRILAARTLAVFSDDPALVIGLRRALQDDSAASVRKAVVETMGSLTPSTSLQRALIASARDEDASVRLAALHALGTYPNVPEIHDLAFQLAQHDRSYRVQAEAVRTLARTSSPIALNVIRSALITPSHRDVIRQAAFEALAFLDLSPEEGLELSLPYTSLDHPAEVRAAAAGYLRILAPNTREALDRLIDLLDDQDVLVRQAAIELLISLDTQPVHEALLNHLQSEQHPILRSTMVRALQRVPSSME